MNRPALTVGFFLLLAFSYSGAAQTQEKTGNPATPEKIQDILIYQDEQYYSAFPSLVVRPDGEILCAFRRAPDRRKLWQAPGVTHTDANSYLVMVRSRDQGKTWTREPELIFAHPLGGSQDPCMVQLRDGSIVCSSYGWALLPAETAEKKKDTLTHTPFAFLGGYILRSDNGGISWKGPFLPIHTPGDNTLDALGRPVAAYNRGAMLQGRDGNLYWAAAANVGPSNRHASVHLLRSSDRGETWQYMCPIARDEKVQFNETSLVETRDGDIVAFMRTADFDGKLTYARSKDGGKSFQPWQDSGFYGYPAHALRLGDDRIFLVYGYRQKPFGIRARLLQPDASDIATATEIVLRDDAGTGDIGYPWSVLLPGGRVLVAYYFNKDNGTRHIAGSLLSLKVKPTTP